MCVLHETKAILNRVYLLCLKMLIFLTVTKTCLIGTFW